MIIWLEVSANVCKWKRYLVADPLWQAKISLAISNRSEPVIWWIESFRAACWCCWFCWRTTYRFCIWCIWKWWWWWWSCRTSYITALWSWFECLTLTVTTSLSSSGSFFIVMLYLPVILNWNNNNISWIELLYFLLKIIACLLL